MTFQRFAALQWIAIAAVLGWLVYLLSPILTPFVAAAILAYICDPWVDRLCAWKLPRTLATLLVMVTLLGAFVLLVLITLPLLQREINLLMTRLPELLDAARTKLLPYLQQHFGITLTWDNATLKDLLASHWQSAGGAAAKALPWLGGGGAALLAMLINLALIPLALFYLLRDWPLLLARIEQAIPRSRHAKVSVIAQEVDRVLAEFLRGQMATMLLMSVFYALALWLTGLEFALPIGIVSGMLVFVPYLGMITGLVLATLAAFTQFDHFTAVLAVWGVFAFGQLLEGMLVTPWLVGDRIGLHPLVVIFALLAFGQLFGFFGILLALPLSATLLVMLRHARDWYLASPLYRD
ncbi:AI-2 transport protein TqsA [Gallionellaceae bacterium]|nr:AI-2 transport protein TqsA [Gallionellaceae bacterium]